VAGQGFNLGLRDAWELAQMLRTVPVRALGDADTVRRYGSSRRIDRAATAAVTHGLVRLFSNDFFPLNAMRGAGMTLLGCVTPARDFLARRMIFGVRG
jgi:2-octaprenyl-6-methoxyphenol hydroxylase